MQLPSRIGKYELQQFLGGGMSHVYRAVDTIIGRTVAVKILTESGCNDAEAKARFLAEARMAGNITHENILSIYDFGEDENHHPYMVMEFLRGEDLRQAIKHKRAGDLRSKLKIVLQTARALEYVHSQKIVHRDIKPENIHIATSGVVKLMDFGIAKTEGLGLTRAGYVLGTPYYMAPEQVMGQNVTDQVDVYAFGILLFELFTGVKPIGGDTLERIFYSILHEPLNLTPLQQSGAPATVCELVSRCAEKDPGRRPQGFGSVCASIEAMLGNFENPTEVMTQGRPVATASATVTAIRETDSESSSLTRRPWLVAAVLGGAVLLGGALYALSRPHSTPPVGAPPVLAATLSLPAGDMRLVPAGTFRAGEKNESLVLPAFYIDETEVTNAAYAEFCKATGRRLPPDFRSSEPNYPVVNVTIVDAHAFALWAGKRLPTAREWEKAARGVDGRLFPWGNNADPSLANINAKKIRPASDFKEGASPYGALQMVGNVWEFVEELSTPSQQALKYFRNELRPSPRADEPWYQIRGESFADRLAPNVVWDSTMVPARWASNNLGFRCAKDAR